VLLLGGGSFSDRTLRQETKDLVGFGTFLGHLFYCHSFLSSLRNQSSHVTEVPMAEDQPKPVLSWGTELGWKDFSYTWSISMNSKM
jgi:hypothetical protein